MRPAATLDAFQAEPAFERVDEARKPVWRRALAGVTPRALTIILVLMLIRSVSSSVEPLLGIRRFDDAVAFVVDTLQGLVHLAIMAATMLVVIIATSNLGPQRGAARTAARGLAKHVGYGHSIHAHHATPDRIV